MGNTHVLLLQSVYQILTLFESVKVIFSLKVGTLCFELQSVHFGQKAVIILTQLLYI